MPFYHEIEKYAAEGKLDRKRALERLISLRKALEAQIPQRTLKEMLLLATWNIRDFDTPDYGYRMQEAIYYIAEIIAAFDLVAIQEVNKDLTGLNRVMAVLGDHWQALFTDTTEGSQGNEERMAFVYDSRKVAFKGLAGELVLPPIKGSDGSLKPSSQFWRTPFLCGFQVGWARFMLATVHIAWGEDKAEPAVRVNEIRQVAQFLKARTEDKTAWARNLILLGDFNIFEPENATFRELTEAGFVIPKELQRQPSSALGARHYDQIAFRVRPGHLETAGRAGVFDYYKTVYRDSAEDEEAYRPYFQAPKGGKAPKEIKQKNYYKTYWRTHQMSDHLPMWVELKIDYSDEYLRRKLDEVAGQPT